MRRVRLGVAAATAALVAGLGGGLGILGAAPAAAQSDANLYLAVGDSLAAGYQNGTKPFTQGYTYDLARAEKLDLTDLACPGETTASMLGAAALPACQTAYENGFGTTSQLSAAEAYLRDHRGHVRLVTLDIGANDVDHCASSTSIDTRCVAQGIATVGKNLPKILDGLRDAAPGVPIVAMNYYDPFLAAWYLEPGQGRRLALESLVLADTFNGLLEGIYTAYGVPVANVAGAFRANDLRPARYRGMTLPRDVADICRWTYMCTAPPDIHPNANGYRVIAGAFEARLTHIDLDGARRGRPWRPWRAL